MELAEQFFLRITELLSDLHRDERKTIDEASEMLVRQIEQRRLIYVFGVGGHSVIGSEEFFWRAGGLACVAPLFDASLLLSGGGRKSTMLERVPGIGDKVVAAAGLSKGDLLVITSIYGMNAATIDAALEAKKRGVKIIAITSRDHAAKTPPDFVARHPSRQNLADLADITIDNHVPHGDTQIQVGEFPQKVGAVSTILVSACIQWLVAETTKRCLDRQIDPPIWQSANIAGGDEKNAGLMAEYLPRIKAL